MCPIEVEPLRYDRDWHHYRPRRKHRFFFGGLVRFVTLVALLAAGGATLSLFHSHSIPDQLIAVSSTPAAGLGVIAAGLPPTTGSHSNVSGQVPKDTGHASAALAPLAPMAIVPAPVVDPSGEVFIGTGDGSNGSWSRP